MVWLQGVQFATGPPSSYNQYMSFLYEVLRDKPLALYMMDDTTPYQDYSGYNRNAIRVSGSNIRYPGIVSGVLSAPVFLNTTTAQFASPVFIQGNEAQPFTIGTWVINSSTANSDQQVLGNNGQMDGITLNGTIVSFVIKFTGGSEARVSYDIQTNRVVFVVGVYTRSKISLYVNGELVDELALTEAQQADTFVATDSNLYAGPSAGSQQIALNGVYIFGRALSGTEISRHYKAGVNVPNSDDVATSLGGVRFPITIDRADTCVDVTYGVDAFWSDGVITGMIEDDGVLIPEQAYDSGSGTYLSIAGRWITAIPLDGAANANIYGIVLDWDGSGAVVQGSANGTSWETAVRGKRLTNSINLAKTTVYQVKVTFPGGSANDESFINSLRVVALDDATMNMNGRVVTVSGGTPNFDYNQEEMRLNWGTKIQASSDSILLSANTTLPATPIRTISFWIRRYDNTGTPTLTLSDGTTGTYYENGTVGDGVTTAGRWTLVHYVSDTDLSGTIKITGPAQVANITLYEDALTATQITEDNQRYTNANFLVVSDMSTFALPDTDSTHKVYAHDWSIVAAG